MGYNIIKYTSENGFSGKLYGKSSLSVYDRKSREVFHTGFRTINTIDELKEFVDTYPEFGKMLAERVKNDDENGSAETL